MIQEYMKALWDDEAEVRAAGCWMAGLYQVDDDAVVERLKELLHDEDEKVARLAKLALAKPGVNMVGVDF